MSAMISFRLNGEARSHATEPDARLIDILRDELHLVAAKKACGIGRCGACAVLMDGLPVNACLLMAWQVEGRKITTPEGLESMPHASILRAALAAENAFQCGYCAPGVTIVLAALLAENPKADEADIRAALEGNICRCTGYHSIIRGALAAVEAMGRSAAGDLP